jgi:hypothetical protein
MIDTVPFVRMVTHAVWISPAACASADPIPPAENVKPNVRPVSPVGGHD